MAGTIAPVVYRDITSRKLNWMMSAFYYTLGSIVGGGLTGLLVAYVGRFALFGLDYLRSIAPFFVGLSAILYALHEMGILSMPHFQRKKQVPSHWRYRFHPYVTAGLYGLMLGAGFMTFIPTTSYIILVLAASFSGSLITGLLILSVFGAARALPLWISGFAVKTIEGWDNITSYVHITKPIMRQINGLGLAMIGVGVMLVA